MGPYRHSEGNLEVYSSKENTIFFRKFSCISVVFFRRNVVGRFWFSLLLCFQIYLGLHVYIHAVGLVAARLRPIE